MTKNDNFSYYVYRNKNFFKYDERFVRVFIAFWDLFEIIKTKNKNLRLPPHINLAIVLKCEFRNVERLKCWLESLDF